MRGTARSRRANWGIAAQAWLLLLLAAHTDAYAGSRAGRELYEQACASCHGSDGRGEAASASGFRKPPDFTDCNFATREADQDWLAIVHLGGPARGFNRAMPAFQQLMSTGQMADVVDYVRQFCKEPRWPRGELNLPLALVTEKAFPEDEAVVTVSRTGGELTSHLVYERRIARGTQIEVNVPFVYVDAHGGIGDIAFALKHVIVSSLASGSILSAAAEVTAPTGRVDRGFGGGTARLEGFLAYGQLLPLGAFVQVQAGIGAAYDRDYADEAFARGALGRPLVPVEHGRMFTPMVELVSARELTSDARTELDVVPELRITLSARQHIRATGGVSIPVTEREGRPTEVMAYLLWDWFDGGLFEGW